MRRQTEAEMKVGGDIVDMIQGGADGGVASLWVRGPAPTILAHDSRSFIPYILET